MDVLFSLLSITTLAGVLSTAAPLIFATLGATLNERAGVINLSVEGTIMLGALFGFAAAYLTNSVLVGFVAAMLVGMILAAIVAYGSITLNRDQVAIGFILAILGVEFSSFAGINFVRIPGPSVSPWPLPFLSNLPIFGRLFFDHDIVTYLSFLLIIGMWWWFYRTQPGLKLRSTGERPMAAFARGVNVVRLRYIYTLLGGALIGFAGAAYSLHIQLGWSHRHTANIGWIALAIVIFGGWHPFRVAFGCYLFAFLRASATSLQPVFPQLPVQLFPLLPFPLMILTLILFNSEVMTRFLRFLPVSWSRPIAAFLRSTPPAGLGQFFQQEKG